MKARQWTGEMLKILQDKFYAILNITIWVFFVYIKLDETAKGIGEKDKTNLFGEPDKVQEKSWRGTLIFMLHVP